MLVLAIPKNLDKLLQDRGVTAITPLRELGGVVIMAINFSFVLVVRVLGAKDGRTDRASEMLNVIFAI